MAQLTRAQLKALFETGDILLESSFVDFIDSAYNKTDDVIGTGATGATGPTGATGSLENTPVNYADFIDQGATAPAYQEGRFYYAEGTFNVYVDEPDILLQVGQESWIKVRNNSGGLIPNGSVVYIDGAQGQRPTVQLASNVSHISAHVIGIATHDIEDSSFGYITVQGLVNGVDTNAFSDGDDLWLGSTAGSFTNVQPEAPTHSVSLGVVVVAANQGSIQVAITNAVDINDITEVLVSNPQDKDRLAYNSITQRWENQKPQDLSFTTVGATGATSYQADSSERIFVENSVAFEVIGATAPAINTVYEIIDRDGNCGTNNITFNGNGKTIRGQATWLMDVDWYVLKVVYNGTEYNII